MNIVHGTAAGGSFKQAFNMPGKEILVFSDVLSCGLLKEFSNIEDWKGYREKFWNAIEDDNSLEKGSFAFGTFHRDFYEEFRDFKNANEFKLWIGTGLSDQLLLVFLVNLFDVLRIELNRLSIFQFEKIKGKKFEIQGLGLLNLEQIRKHPEPYVLTDEQAKFARSCWEAIVDSNPEKYIRLISSKNECMPLLSKAMAYLFYRYPKSSNGLSHWDELLLKCTAEHGPTAARIIGYTLTDYIEGLDWIGDSYLFSRLKNMGRPSLNSPLIEANALDLPMRHTQIKILPNGIKALEGRLNVIESNGIDDWVGGVHLDSSTGGVWLRKDKTLFYQKL